MLPPIVNLPCAVSALINEQRKMLMPDKARLQQELEELQAQYSKTKYNKATDKYLGLLRAKMAKLRRSLAEKKSKKGTGFGVRKSGNATVVLVGFPNAGKSSLLKQLTHAESKVADYAFTTLDVIPGMLEHNGARIQVLDVPGLIEGAHVGKGAGTQIASVIRIADLLLFVIDATVPGQLEKLLDELSLLDIEVNREKPKILVEERKAGGIETEPNGHKIPGRREVEMALHETGLYNGRVIFYNDIDLDEMIALLVDNAVYVKGIVALNKTDLLKEQDVGKAEKETRGQFGAGVVCVSAANGTNMDLLKDSIFANLGLIRVYLKPKDKEADYSKPFVLRQGSSLMDLAKGLHSKTVKNLRYGLVTGKSARFTGQKCGSEHVLMDSDVVTLVYLKQ